MIVGPETSDDAGAVRLPDGSALLATVDFITPICDDGATFGRIAAANAASDVFAMGGRGLVALSIACFPSEGWPMSLLGDILRGGAEKLAEAGIPVVGGHTVDDPEMKIGYAVMGLVRPESIWRNSTARPGDVLILTKPLGTGILAAAARSGRHGAWWDAALESMSRLNAPASSALQDGGVHAATDVTGFGLAGHAAEMARGSGVTLRIDTRAVPLLEGALDMQKQGFTTRGRATNRAYAQPWQVQPGVSDALVDVIVDPQTSGGLLVAADPASNALGRLREASVFAAEIGVVEPRGSADLVLA